MIETGLFKMSIMMINNDAEFHLKDNLSRSLAVNPINLVESKDSMSDIFEVIKDFIITYSI